MALHGQLTRQGEALFRWRSFVPLALLPLAAFAVAGHVWTGSTPVQPVAGLWWALAVLLAAAGQGLRLAVTGLTPRGTSGRNTAKGQEARSLNTTGPYSLCRNPLYLGNLLIWLALVMGLESPWLVVVAALAFALHYERIILAEEAFLAQKFGRAYAEWAERTPAFWPDPRRWQPTGERFHRKRAWQKESPGLLLLGGGFPLLRALDGLAVAGRGVGPWLAGDWPWLVAGLALVGLGAWPRLARTVKRRRKRARKARAKASG